LVNAGVISASDLIHALNQQLQVEAPLGEILIAEYLVDPETVLDALALHSAAQRIDRQVALVNTPRLDPKAYNFERTFVREIKSNYRNHNGLVCRAWNCGSRRG
jgi:hypothetical protein